MTMTITTHKPFTFTNIINMLNISTLLYLHLLVLLLLIQPSHTFISSSYKSYKKCFNSTLTPRNTLQIQFGFPRLTHQNCKFQLIITYIQLPLSGIEKQSSKQVLYNHTLYCIDRNPNDLILLKYTKSNYYNTSRYHICVQNLDDYRMNKTYYQLNINQKHDISNMAELANSTLVRSTAMIDLEETIQMIKRKLSWQKEFVKKAQMYGNQLEDISREADSIIKKMTYIQIGFLIGYGIVWVIVVKNIAQKQRRI